MRPSPSRCRRLRRWVCASALLLASCGGAGTGGGAVPGAPLQVAVSVPPQAFFVERLGGEHVRVEVMVPPGTSPDSYEPTPQQVLALARARLYVAVGHPGFTFETAHLGRLLADRPALPVVDMAEGIAFLPLEEPGHGGSDPHVWVAPATVRVAAANIARGLAAADPAHAAVYRENLNRFEGEIEALDRFIHSRLDGLPHRRFWVYHPAWGYFAAEYGLEQVALEEEGKEAGPARLVGLVEQARREGVRTLFVQQGFSDKSARLIAGEIGARLVVLDPLAYDWLDNLRRVTFALEEALGENGG